MGLDMYLEKRITLYLKDEELEDLGLTSSSIKNLRKMNTQYIQVSVVYWRKVSCVHKFFMDIASSYENHEGTIFVNTNDLKKLRDLCKEVLADHTKAEELLPTMDGFFFGSLEYNDDYFEDLKYTIDTLEDNVDFNSYDLYQYIYFY